MTDSKTAGADSVSRQLTGADAPGATNHEGQVGLTGRIDTRTQGKANRPTGTSTARDSSCVDPQESVTDGEFHDAVVPAAKVATPSRRQPAAAGWRLAATEPGPPG